MLFRFELIPVFVAPGERQLVFFQGFGVWAETCNHLRRECSGNKQHGKHRTDRGVGRIHTNGYAKDFSDRWKYSGIRICLADSSVDLTERECTRHAARR